MRTVAVGRRNALIIVTAMSLAGCGGSQPPIGAAGMLTIIGLVQGEHASTPARCNRLSRRRRSTSWVTTDVGRRHSATSTTSRKIKAGLLTRCNRTSRHLRSSNRSVTKHLRRESRGASGSAIAHESTAESIAATSPTRDPNNDGFALLHTGENQFRQRQYADALHTYQEALALFQQLRDRDGEAKALMNIGLVQETNSSTRRATKRAAGTRAVPAAG